MESLMKQFEHLKIQWEDITSATNNFDQNNYIGGGGFGKVYTGALARFKDRSVVAFKRLDRKHGQGDAEFLKEITFLSCYTHENLISLLGFCIQQKEMILVYEYASRGSLDRHLHSSDLTWTQRLKICLSAAKGLNHLHDPRETSQRLIHCDVKSANILLDDKWNAKVADFGLSKVGPANQQNSVLVTNPLGTVGYCDPLFMETYSLTKESDVYSFGVVLFEVLCGRLCSQTSNNGQLQVLVAMWKKRYEENKVHEIIFPDLRQNMDPTSLKIFSEIAFQCLKRSREERPKMSLVMDKLGIALKCQEDFELQLQQLLRMEVREYEEILDAAEPPLTYSSLKELKALLSNGFLVNGGTTWISMNDDEQLIKLTSIKECLVRFYLIDYHGRYSDDNNSRFKVGTYNTRSGYFTTSITTKNLSPYITYTVNLVFKCPQILKEKSKKQYMSLIYDINEGEKKISIVHVGEKREDEWLVTRLHHFTTNDHSSIVDLKIKFWNHEYSLQIEGIEFQPLPLEIDNVDDDDELDEKKKYEKIVKSAEPPLFYTSLHQLKLLLSKGVHLNGGKTWFHLNDSRQHCELISIKEAIIPYEGGNYYHFDQRNYISRFVVGALRGLNPTFQVCVRPQFLTPLVTYTVNLVFKFADETKLQPKQPNIGLKYIVEGQTKSSYSYIIDKREDGWWMVELCHFTTEQGTTTADLQIIFEGATSQWLVVEGIEFLPVQQLEKAEQHLEETQPISSDSDSDTYREQNLPIDYEDIIKMAKDTEPMNTTKKELCLILSNGFLLKNGQEWLSLDKNAKKSLMLSPRAAVDMDVNEMTWQSIPGSRFGETLHVRYPVRFNIVSEIKSQVLESETTYATYLVYKLPESDQSKFEGLLKVMDGKDLGSDAEEADYWYVFLVSPQTPVISARGKVDQYTHKPLNRPDLKAIPKERRDGWMEVQVWEFQTPTPTTAEIIPISLKFFSHVVLFGLIIQGIDFRPIL